MDLPRAKDLKSDLVGGLTTGLAPTAGVMAADAFATAKPTPETAAGLGRRPGVQAGAGEPVTP